MKKIIVTGSIAYDHIMFFDGEFRDSIIPEDLDHLSLSLLAKSRNTFFGGCAANVAYTLKLLEENPLIFAVAGNDFEKYRNWLNGNNISAEYIKIDDHKPTAAAYILDDKRQNQITIFSPGAMENLDLCRHLDGCDPGTTTCAIITPDIPKRMIYMAEDCIKKGINYIFDPGQAIPLLFKDYLEMIIEKSAGLITNEYEADLLAEKLRIPIEKIADRSGFLIKTLGEGGCELFKKGKREIIPAIPGLPIVDVTGCGDAFRAGFLHGFVNKKSLEHCCEMGNTAASFVINIWGTQEHKFSLEDFESRLKANY